LALWAATGAFTTTSNPQSARVSGLQLDIITFVTSSPKLDHSQQPGAWIDPHLDSTIYANQLYFSR
jgi:hypothetical protein